MSDIPLLGLCLSFLCMCGCVCVYVCVLCCDCECVCVRVFVNECESIYMCVCNLVCLAQNFRLSANGLSNEWSTLATFLCVCVCVCVSVPVCCQVCRRTQSGWYLGETIARKIKAI